VLHLPLPICYSGYIGRKFWETKARPLVAPFLLGKISRRLAENGKELYQFYLDMMDKSRACYFALNEITSIY